MKAICSLLFSVIFLLPADLSGENSVLPKFNPTAVGEGPVLVFKQPKLNSDELALYMFDPATHEKPQIIWQDLYHPNPKPLKRLSAQLILIEFQDQLQLVDLPTGVVTPLLTGQEQNQLVATEGKTIYFFKRTIPKTSKDTGIGLKSGKQGKTVVEKYFRPRDILFCYETGVGGGIKKVSPIAIEHLLEVTDDGFFVITADAPQKIAKISRDGSLTEICPFDSQWVAAMTTHAFSPKKGYLALGILELGKDFHEERTLVVCDLKANKACFSDPNIPLGLNMFSGRSNYLDLKWRSETVLEYGGPFSFAGMGETKSRLANVSTQIRLEKEAMSNLPAIPRDEESKRKKLGQFELSFCEVYYPGDKSPVASGLDEQGVGVRDLVTDTKGLWAAYSERKDDLIYLIDGVNRTKKAIHAGWAHDFQWFEVEAEK